MRISDWSSEVCSSDLNLPTGVRRGETIAARRNCMVISSCCSDVSFWRSDRAFELASGRPQVGQVFFHQIFAAVGVGEGRDVEGGEDVSIAVAYRHRQRSQAGLEFLL